MMSDLVSGVKAFLTGRTFQILFNGAKSPTALVGSEVPRLFCPGSPAVFAVRQRHSFSPLVNLPLFGCRCKANRPRVQLAAVAKKKPLALQRWSFDWDPLINAQKCAVLQIGVQSSTTLTFNPVVE